MAAHARELAGQRFGRLLVIERAPITAHFAMWRCQCECGTERVLSSNVLLRKVGPTRSCGCLARELSRVRQKPDPTIHGEKRGGRQTPEYSCWLEIKRRCFNPRCDGYAIYGGRGITMSSEWRESFDAFLAAVGRRPSRLHSIDRIDNDGDYTPSNVKWSTRREQNINRRPFAEWRGGPRHRASDGTFTVTH